MAVSTHAESDLLFYKDFLENSLATNDFSDLKPEIDNFVDKHLKESRRLVLVTVRA